MRKVDTSPHVLNMLKYVCGDGFEFFLPAPATDKTTKLPIVDRREAEIAQTLADHFPKLRSKRGCDPVTVIVQEYSCFLRENALLYRATKKYKVEMPLEPLDSDSYATALRESLPFATFPKCLQSFVISVVADHDFNNYEAMLSSVEDVSQRLQATLAQLDADKEA